MASHHRFRSQPISPSPLWLWRLRSSQKAVQVVCWSQDIVQTTARDAGAAAAVVHTRPAWRRSARAMAAARPFFGCYLLVSLNPEARVRSYIG